MMESVGRNFMSRAPFLCALIALIGSALFSEASASPLEALSSNDADEVREAIEELSLSGDPEAARAIRSLLEGGLPRALTESAIDALVMLEDKESLPLLLALANHRDTSVRMRALEAATILGPAPQLEQIFLRALEENEPKVRAIAIQGLVRHGSKASLPTLERALARRDYAAAEAIAQLGAEANIRPLIALAGRVPLDELRGAFAVILKRAELGERLRLDALSALVELATPEVKYFLEDLAPTLPGGARDRVRRAVNDAAFRIMD